jgi:hypothetical protein
MALIPLIPAGFALVAYLRFLRRMDELGRRIQLEALAFGFGAARMLTLAYGFLENSGFPQLSYIWVFPTMIALWGIGPRSPRTATDEEPSSRASRGARLVAR